MLLEQGLLTQMDIAFLCFAKFEQTPGYCLAYFKFFGGALKFDFCLQI